MGLNYTLSTHLTRHVTAALPKMAHDTDALHDILCAIAADTKNMYEEGVCNSMGERFFVVIINVVGDWQFLQKAGYLTRTYSNCAKRPWGPKSVPKGICHLCLADQKHGPNASDRVAWENYRVYNYGQNVLPAWHSTLHTVDPWDESAPSPLNGIPYMANEIAGLYTYDLFHSFHLGVGKTLVASCLALASEQMISSNVSVRLEELTALYLTWAEENHEKTFVSQITKANLGWPDTGTMPNGQWSKGHVTTTLLKFFISWARNTNLNGHELLQLSLQACLEVSECLEMLYKEGVWIEQRKASQIAGHGMQFLNLYRTLAFKSFENGQALFAHMPKGHSMDHIFFDLHKASATKPFCLNPLIFSVQLFEDYIGRCSRVSRRTSPQQVVTRVLGRCLQAGYKYWYEGGYIKD